MAKYICGKNILKSPFPFLRGVLLSMDENGSLSEILVMLCHKYLAIFSLLTQNFQVLNALVAGMWSPIGMSNLPFNYLCNLYSSGLTVVWFFFFLCFSYLFFLKGHFLYFSLCPLPLVLSLVTTEKSLSQSASLHPTSYLCTLIRSPLSLFFSRLNNPSASFCFSSHSFLHVSHSLGSGHAFVCLHGELCQGSDLGWK